MTDEIEENVKHDPHLEAQGDAWMATNPLADIPDVSDDEVREAIIKDLSNVCKMTVGEYTLYQKWCEVHEKYPTQTVSTLFGDEVQMKDLDKAAWISQTKDNVWFPESVDDYLNLQPELVYTKEAELSETWNMIRNFTSTMKNNSNIGRNLNYLVVDRKSGKYLGLICISSDFLDQQL